MAGAIDHRLLTRAKATRTYLIAGVAVGSATAVLVVCQAWILSRMIARVFDSRGPEGTQPGSIDAMPFGGLWAAIGVLAAIIAGRALLAWLNSWLAHRSAAAVKSQLRSDIIAARLRAPGRTDTSTGSLIALLTHGLDALDGYFARYLPQLALAFTVPLIVGVAIFTTHVTSALIVAVSLPLIPVFMVLIGLATKVRMAKSWRTQRRLANHFGDLVTGLPTLQAFGRAKNQTIGLEITEKKHRSETMSTLRVSFLSGFALELLATYSVALVAVPVGLLIVDNRMDLVTGLFVLILVPEVYLPVRQVGVHYHDSVDGIAAADDAFAVIERAGGKPGIVPAPSLVDAPIRLDRVSFTYPEAKSPALVDFSAEVRPGEVVAFAGPSGCGKSTALALLMGFWTPSEGSIAVGDRLLFELDIASWREQLAYVAQEPGLVSGTIADNVRLGDPTADDAAVADALRRAGGAGLAPERDVDDAGENLSAGEIRRIAMARALLRIDAGARLLVLDEPTAGLDSDTEAQVLAGVRRSGVGALVVTHRPAVLAAADRVIELPAPHADEPEPTPSSDHALQGSEAH
ncbi:thiol reductant ABC exporter subunit CydD [Granulicoccus sp. GXG6511]|uniref:thiol reductant ABC exporter subunit CydD n=1 Tax=Granulicoccus sp. GXG6511 TaxID=3381351 RepID=UPI003D7E1085